MKKIVASMMALLLGLILLLVNPVAAMAQTGEIQGVKWKDQNGNGTRDRSLLQGDKPDIVFVIDLSGSTGRGFEGTAVGDVNGDGRANTILDAELAGVKALNQQLIKQGLGETADVGLVKFSSTAKSILVTTPIADKNGNGTPDVEDTFSTMGSGGATNFEAALQVAEQIINSLGTAAGDGNVVFLSDGVGSGNFSDEVTRLQAAGVNISAFGVGGGAQLQQLQQMDPNAERFTTTDEILELFSGLKGRKSGPLEPGIPGVTVYLDSNNNSVVDPGEITQVTDQNGEYKFTSLPPGTYSVREVIPCGYKQTAPGSGSHTVKLNAGSVVGNIDFGNVFTSPETPILVNPIADQSATSPKAFSLRVPSNTFCDPDGDSLSLSATLDNGASLPDWLSFDPESGTFSGTPSRADVGTISIKVTAEDCKGGVTSDTFNLTVIKGNDPPVVNSPLPDRTITAGQDFSETVPDGTFTDPDGDNLTLSATLKNGDPLPSWLTFDPTTAEFSGTPGNGDISSICITVTADDGNGGVVSDTFNAIVQSALAQKETFINPDNGHIYFLTEALSWTEAQAEASSVDGNLVTINDLEENDWLRGTFGTAEPFWIGLNDAAVEGSFEWVSGQEPDIYFDEYWSSTQPDSGYSGGEEEDYVVMNWRDYSDPSGGWGDVENAGPNYGEAVPGIVEVEPETLDYDLSVLQPEPKDCQ